MRTQEEPAQGTLNVVVKEIKYLDGKFCSMGKPLLASGGEKRKRR